MYPCLVWRSLLEARELIKAGTAWHVGDGQSIEVNDHRWLNHPPQFRPGADTNLKVADLIDHRIRQWNRLLLHITFLQSTVEDILRIKLGEEHDRDKVRWKETKNGCFSVKTAYRVALCLNQPENPEHSTAREDKKFWNKMWKLPIPPKVRNFMWRTCSDILPTSANLCRWRVPVASSSTQWQLQEFCPGCSYSTLKKFRVISVYFGCFETFRTICQQHEETVAHVLWECPIARNVWGMVQGQLQKCNSEASNFYILARQLEEKLPKKDLELWAMVSWSIWNARNRFHFEKKQSTPSDILQGVTTLLQEYQRHCRTSTRT
ncbi:hypothetical protein SO802_015814 [Lithocarpus litseifolius]|uniref:Reverse transcriptase zinc-binding domain-containing protein n=1 Tax=Lithocarpus litseifolius TaxID=425828 RepID=A0AAW2CX51_9ROSI